MKFSITAALAISAAVANGLQLAKPSVSQKSPSAGDKTRVHVPRELLPRKISVRQSDFCSGKGVTCESCFGDGYKECPDDASTCYAPGSIEDCDGSSSGGGSGGSDDDSDSGSGGGSAGDSDFCSGKGVTCESCFGDGYQECPDDESKCYAPGSIKDCDGSGSGGGSGGSGGSDDDSDSEDDSDGGSAGDSDFCSGKGVTCESCFGEGYKECPDDESKCYAPGSIEDCEGSGSSPTGSPSSSPTDSDSTPLPTSPPDDSDDSDSGSDDSSSGGSPDNSSPDLNENAASSMVAGGLLPLVAGGLGLIALF